MRFGADLARFALITLAGVGVLAFAFGLFALVKAFAQSDALGWFSSGYMILSGIGCIAGGMTGLAVVDIAEELERTSFAIREALKVQDRGNATKR